MLMAGGSTHPRPRPATRSGRRTPVPYEVVVAMRASQAAATAARTNPVVRTARAPSFGRSLMEAICPAAIASRTCTATRPIVPTGSRTTPRTCRTRSGRRSVLSCRSRPGWRAGAGSLRATATVRCWTRSATSSRARSPGGRCWWTSPPGPGAMVRTGHLPRTMASLRNLAMGVHRQDGATNTSRNAPDRGVLLRAKGSGVSAPDWE